MTLEQKKEAAVWTAKSLFERNKTTGSSANISFLHDGMIYISAGGTCFGTLTAGDFAAVSPDGTVHSVQQPSKELPLHMMLYEKDSSTGAVIHTHSTYSILWSLTAYAAAHPHDCIPPLTPYLRMKLGAVGLIPFEQPGSAELFQTFKQQMGSSNGFLLKQHGPIVPGKDMMDAFYCLEELEESARIAWKLNAVDPI